MWCPRIFLTNLFILVSLEHQDEESVRTTVETYDKLQYFLQDWIRNTRFKNLIIPSTGHCPVVRALMWCRFAMDGLIIF